MSLNFLSIKMLNNFNLRFHNPAHLLSVMGVKEDDWVLEIGCCTGYYTIPLAQLARGGRIYAVDTCDKALSSLNKNCSNGHNIKTICCSPDALQLPRLSLDKIFCLNGLPQLSDLERGIALWCGFLKSRGKFFLRANRFLTPHDVEAISKDSLYPSGRIKGVNVFIKDGEDDTDDTEQPIELYCSLLPDMLF
jgi:ubiquinone/menaquinone biosynthesis C-methylase UbiE